MAKQGHRSHPLTHQTGDFIDDFVHRTALLAPAYVGNNAITAKIITSRHDGNPRMIGSLAMPGHIGGRARVDFLNADMAGTVNKSVSEKFAHMSD